MSKVAKVTSAPLIGAGINAILAAAKIGGGIMGNSTALIADGIESSADVVSSLVVWGGLRKCFDRQLLPVGVHSQPDGSEADLTAENFSYNLQQAMSKRLAALFIVLAFASQTLAGGFACDGDDRNSAAGMACCAQAKSANPSPVAMLCCQTVCGEPTSEMPGPQSETPTGGQQVPAPPVAVIDNFVASLKLPLAIAASLYKDRADALLLDLDPPALYIRNSAFLI